MFGRRPRASPPEASPPAGVDHAGDPDDLGDAEPEAVAIPIDGCLDLHAFDPRDLRPLVNDYLDLCRAAGLLEVRIVHGKGRGHLRRSVHALLSRRLDVLGYRLAPETRGGWGATLVDLAPPDPDP